MGCSPAAQKNQTNNLLHLGIVDLFRGIGGAMIVWMEAGMKKKYRYVIGEKGPMIAPSKQIGRDIVVLEFEF
jgi:hypothetical protein